MSNQSASAIEITNAIRTISTFSVVVSAISLGIYIMVSPSRRMFLYISPFTKAINNRIRYVMEVPAEGDVSVILEAK